MDWKKQQKEIRQEHDKRGFDGRFGVGLPRVNDGSVLFLQHLVDKFEPVRPASRMLFKYWTARCRQRCRRITSFFTPEIAAA